MKLLIAIPSLDMINSEFVKSLVKLIRRLDRDGIQFDVEILNGTLVYIGRDRLARKAVNEGYTHVLWLDSDMLFTENLLEDLMFLDKDMVCGLYISRHSPYVGVMFKSLDPVVRMNDIPEGPVEIAGCGFGCVLVRTEVIRDVMLSNKGNCFLPMANLGEDLAFCYRARSLGYHIWCDTSVRLGHVGNVVIWPEDQKKLISDINGLEGRKIE